MKYGMYHVVVYDGMQAWVAYFILSNKTAREDANKYIGEGNGEVLKVAKLYDLNHDEVMAILNPNNWEGGVEDINKANNAREYGYECIADRFKNMYL